MDPKSLFSLNDHLEMLSRHGDPLEVLERTVDFEYFRVWLGRRTWLWPWQQGRPSAV
ncbi:hypothetical protein EBBID32_26700 [Sphingobium indicum BiD32]|uniref:Uncharacterized protein n=1 Tax=Sphingobium indicum BiD32 TaxID=1301087 RepID=N1MNL7_9SPHN|nr:hypothetical protein EBBID32_26700 [Sphingobium indicum BiD32]